LEFPETVVSIPETLSIPEMVSILVPDKDIPDEGSIPEMVVVVNTKVIDTDKASEGKRVVR